MNANVIIYCRVSSDEQTLGASLDIQEERLRKYCNQMGYNIIDNIPYREDESAKTFEKRPVIQGIMNYIRKNKGKVNKLLFLRWDRYSRDIISASENLKELIKLGVEPNAIEAPLDFNSDTWPLLLGVHIGSAQCDNIKRSKATMDGIHGTLAKGKCANKAPRGYKNVRISKHETHVEIDTNTAPFIPYLRKWLKALKHLVISVGSLQEKDIIYPKVHFLKCYVTNFISVKFVCQHTKENTNIM